MAGKLDKLKAIGTKVKPPKNGGINPKAGVPAKPSAPKKADVMAKLAKVKTATPAPAKKAIRKTSAISNVAPMRAVAPRPMQAKYNSVRRRLMDKRLGF